MELKDLLGKHVLTGCQYGQIVKKEDWQNSDPNTVDFILDGKTLSVIEDPHDGYRSSMDELIESRPGVVVTNTFEPCEVVGTFRDHPYQEDNVIDFIDIMTGKKVLSIGTQNVDDYYPCFVGVFNPENMAINNQEK